MLGLGLQAEYKIRTDPNECVMAVISRGTI